MTKIIAECGLNWLGPDDARALGLACLAAGADYVKFQLLLDPYRTARDRGLAPDEAEEWAKRIPRMTLDEWGNVLSDIPREKRMVSVFSPADVLAAVQLRVDNIKIGHKEHRLVPLAYMYAKNLCVSNYAGLRGVSVNCLYCVEEYPATFEQCRDLILIYVAHGYSDHSDPTLRATRFALDCGVPLIEIHVRPDGPLRYLDDAVSKSIAQLAELCKEAHK